jgi:starch phosphorylase
MWWTWDPEAPALFEAVDRRLWSACEHNPVMLLQRLSSRRSGELTADRAVLARLGRVHRRMRAYQRGTTWFADRHGRRGRGLVAYFSMEFGLHESLPMFAGGLGVLAGDHLKSASDLGVPLVGVGIFWRRGYTRQQIDSAGRQVTKYDRLSPERLPLSEVRSPSGRLLRVRFAVGHDVVVARAWQLEVGRVKILLLDTNLPENPPRHRKLTERLYSGDRDTRIRQEIVLGVGGWKLLRALRLPVRACHLNEGHAAFCALERVAETIRGQGCDFAAAARQVAGTTLFTTHTPVPEGNEVFDAKLVERYFGRHSRRFGLDWPGLLALGRVRPDDESEPFGMTPLALRLSDRRNGVAALHGQVSRRMWKGVWPKRTEERVPIGSITNGIHLRTWLHPKMGALLDEFLPSGWDRRQDQGAVWAAALEIPDARLWAVHQELKAELVAFVRARLRGQLKRQGAGAGWLRAVESVLDPDGLTIGFARRFASYKRATLIFSDIARFARLVGHARRPVQIIFAGKAHPDDAAGQALVAEVARCARSPGFRQWVVFLENYDMDMARHLVAGVDVWLNNPRRPQEASGTSGMKPTLHGGLNLSILDGWWPEACRDGVNGWAIGKGEDHTGTPAADRREARSLYQRLERDVVPLYYDRASDGLPRKWLRRMKASMASIPPAFNSHRMVKQYVRRYYVPMLARARRP